MGLPPVAPQLSPTSSGSCTQAASGARSEPQGPQMSQEELAREPEAEAGPFPVAPRPSLWAWFC